MKTKKNINRLFKIEVKNYIDADTLTTLIENGGGNLKNNKIVKYNSGFMVSYKDLFTINTDVYSINTIVKVINFNLSKYHVKKTENVGFWLDGSILFIDLSKNYKRFKNALKCGVLHKQIAIYDLNNNKSIYLNNI